MSEFNSLGEHRYYDTVSQSSFEFDHATQKASAVQSHTLESSQSDLVYVLHPKACHGTQTADADESTASH